MSVIAPGYIANIPIGTYLTPPPSTWLAGVTTSSNWTANSNPPLPSKISAIWVEGSCSIKVDGGGQIGLTINGVQGGWLPIPPNVNITTIYTPGLGSTGAVIDFVVN